MDNRRRRHTDQRKRKTPEEMGVAQRRTLVLDTPKTGHLEQPSCTAPVSVRNATRQALEDETDVHVRLKWPNDLVIESGKLGGILIESKTIGDRASFVVVGIGLNVNLRKTQLPTGAVSLFATTGTKYDLRRLLKTIADQTMSKYDEIDKPSSILEEW